MPYIGNQHNVGDHVNNFKVLDDISSYTATFDGSATSVVSTSAETIRIPEHRFIQGQRVTYNNGGGSNIGGLTSGTAYYVSFDSANTIKLATSLANANNNIVINLSSVGSGTSHTLNAAFDGVNTKFKLTFGSGNPARLNNATQINVAINNVIQRPNLDANNFTDGFALADNHKIVFKTAPTSQDIFWGSIIANTIENFDLRDNEVDNFTGNGSTTEFTLSTIPANNESVIVTIDGVLQHPSDKDTERAYTLIDSILKFTAAPALNAEIQARHIGFAGATTGDVSGFYGRTGNVVLGSSDHITTGDITSRNINASGILTASSASFGGNVSIGGTLTYEDVTNIDSVGVITAREGIFLPNNKHISLGTGNDMRIYSAAGGLNNSFLKKTGTGPLNFDFQGDFLIRNTNGTMRGKFTGPLGAVELHHSGQKKFETTSSGVSITQDLDVDGHTNLDNLSVAGVSTFSGIVAAGVGSTAITLSNSHKMTFGSAHELEMFHDGSNSYIKNRYNGYPSVLNIISENSGINIMSGNGSNSHGGYENAIRCIPNGAVELYWSGAKHLETYGAGVMIQGNLQVGQDIAHHTDIDTKMKFPAHNTISFETTGSERLRITSAGLVGINTASPTARLEIVESNVKTWTPTSQTELLVERSGNCIVSIVGRNDSNCQLAFGDNDDENAGYIDYDHADNSMAFRTNASERLRINSSGFIGIGTATVNRGPLEISRSDTSDVQIHMTNAKTGGGSGKGFTIFAGNVGHGDAGFVNRHSGGAIEFYTNQGGTLEERLRITSDGKMGLGTNNPNSEIHLSKLGASDEPTIKISSENSSIFLRTAGSSGAFPTGGTGNDGELVYLGGDFRFGVGTASKNLIFFNGSGYTERLRINSDGYLGLGTNNPNTPLHVYHPTINGVALFQSGDAYCNLILQDGNSNTSSKPQFGVQGDDFRFVSTGTERLRISSSGGSTFYNDVTIDTTAAATSADLTIRAGEGGSAYLYMIADDGDDGGDNWRIGAMSGFSNRLIFYNSASGSYTDVVSFQTDGTIRPGTNSANLGTSTERWANVYTNDLHLSNQGSTNSVDNTWGDFTIQEGESDLFLINNRNGKKYKFNLTEVS